MLFSCLHGSEAVQSRLDQLGVFLSCLYGSEVEMLLLNPLTSHEKAPYTHA